jgi:2-polyprenyl-3-methyl-5-hydroxy-6-metoxy-1,4-benzoquinol methylase
MHCHLQRHPETKLSLDELGAPRPYRTTIPFEGQYIDSTHEGIARLPIANGPCIQWPNGNTGEAIVGWLQAADAMKLYELAYFCPGDILEIGTHQGLSTIVMAAALQNRGDAIRIHTIDLDPWCIETARNNFRRNGVDDWIAATSEDAVAAIRRLAATPQRFAFAFVDHAHEYAPVVEVCNEIERVLLPDAFVLFHDYNDPTNRAPNGYGVYQGVQDALPGQFEFFGAYGCTALFRLSS